MLSTKFCSLFMGNSELPHFPLIDLAMPENKKYVTNQSETVKSHESNHIHFVILVVLEINDRRVRRH